jgi:anti-anti-sigma factor
MNLTTSHVGRIAVLRIHEARLTHPMLPDLAARAGGVIASGHPNLLVDLSAVNYLDSATIGCLMDLYRQATAGGGTVKLCGVQKRVETMLTMTGAHNFLEFHADESSALASFGG